MNLRLLWATACLLLLGNISLAQTTVLDFEAPATSTNFFYFGSTLDGTVVGPVANPDMSGINMSDSVMMHIRPDSAASFAGAFTDPNPTQAIDVTNGDDICLNVWMPVSGNVRLKLEQSTTGGGDWELEIPVTTTMQWEDICFDSNLPSSANPGVTAAGNSYARMVIFFNFGQVNSPVSDTFYFDNVVLNPPVVNPPPTPGVCNTVLDFEDAATTTNFFYFGSDLDGTVVGPVANPDMSGINMSDSVMQHIRPDSAASFAGAFTDPNPMTPINLANGEEICMNVWMPGAGNVRIKLEQSTTGGSDWELELPVATAMAWEEICFDSNMPSAANPGVMAAGNSYDRMVIFFNFGQVNSPVSDTFYFDNICLQVADSTPPPMPGVCNTILDFEDAATTTNFFYFGSDLDGTVVGPVANPDMSGINMSDSVMQHIRPDSAASFAGAFTDPNPMTPINLANGEEICMNVWMPGAGNVRIKLEQSTTGGSDWELELPVATAMAWEEICFDSNMPSAANPGVTAAGNSYDRMVIFFNFGQVNSPVSDTFYFDNICTQVPDTTTDPPGPTVCNTVLDFEDAATTTNFFYFGSDLDGTVVGPIANPDMSGINMSDSVMIHIRPDSAANFAGAFTDPNPMTPFDVTNGGDICVDVWMPAAGTVRLKLEQSSTGGSDWELEESVASAAMWENICFDSNMPSVANPGVTAAGNSYARMVIFFNFGLTNSPVSDTFYFDNVCVEGDSMMTADSVDVDFALNLNGYTGSGTQPYVSGTFNGFSGTANPLSDDDMDGIWTTTVRMVDGPIEYKFQFDDWAVQEEFNGTEVCVIRDPSGQFVNRFAEIMGSTSLDTVCWNSCYDCGNAVQITYNLGFPSGTTPSMDGIYLAGGAFFGAPGGEFGMTDDDMDGIYTITIEREIGFNTFYTFANGNCPDYSCKEVITGQDCARPDNFDDRFLTPVMADTVLNTCFAICSDSTDCSVTSIREQLVSDLFSLLPNPGQDYTEVQFVNDPIQSTIIEVMDMQGKQVYVQEVSAGINSHTLRLTNWNAGIYLVMLRQGVKVGVQKLKVE